MTTHESTTFLIFGASGDLTSRKLIPALFNLYLKGRINGKLNIVGSARTDYSHDDFRADMRKELDDHMDTSFSDADWQKFAEHIYYVPGDATKEQDYDDLLDFLATIEGESANRLYYLAVAPFLYMPIVEKLGETGMAKEAGGWRRIVVEKPFGHDLESAKELNHALHRVFGENQIYRIDHYLGKETAQNILFMRFANTIFEPVWNRNYVDHVQITVAETVDIGHRAGFYDKAGVLRDMFQNHLMQLLALVAMEPPASFNADALRNEKVKVLSAIRPIDLQDTVRAQYEGYCETEGVAPDSQTPTFAALKLNIDNWRWQGVPFYLRSGKALTRKMSEVVVEFKCPPHMMFARESDDCFTPNALSLCIQPDEGVHFKFEAKEPGSYQETRSVDMEFHYRSAFGNEPLPDAYERLLLDALNGDASLFTRHDEIETAWQLIDPIIEGWKSNPDATPLAHYRRGSMGPEAAEDFITRDDRMWREECKHEDC